MTTAILGAALGCLAIFVALQRFARPPELPEVALASLSIDRVRRGDLAREIQGVGVLDAEDVIHVPAASAGRVAQVNALNGAVIDIDDVLVVLANPELEQQALDCEWSLRTSEADLNNLNAQLRSRVAADRADMATIEGQLRNAKLRLDRDRKLFERGMMIDLDYRLSVNAVEDLTTRVTLEREKSAAAEQSMQAQIAGRELSIEQLKATLKQRRQQLAALRVHSTFGGTVAQVLVQSGQHVPAGQDLVVIVRPGRLRALLNVPDVQARDVVVGQAAEIEVGGDLVRGRVARIEPMSGNGVRTVDVLLIDAVPKGAAPAQPVRGKIEVERLSDVTYIRRPPGVSALREAFVYRLSPDGAEASRARVRFGRESIQDIEISAGLNVGDRVIVSDLSALESHTRIRLK